MNNDGGSPVTDPVLTHHRVLRTLVVATLVAASLGLGATPAEAQRTPNGPDSISVYRLYRAAFLREPDAGGLTYWYRDQLEGNPLEAIAEHFARSPEFVSRYGHLSDAGFVDQMYQNVFGRRPDSAGRVHWVDQLGRGNVTRGRVLLGFSDSAEFKAHTLAAAGDPHPDPSTYSLDDFRWDPCSPVEVVANLEHAPPLAEEWLNVALLRMSDVTGVDWRYLGPTTARSTPDAVFPLPDEWGSAVPVLVQWEPTMPMSGTHYLSGVAWAGEIFQVRSAVVVLGGPSFESGRLTAGIATRQFSQVFGLQPVRAPGNILDVSPSAWGWGPGDLEGFRQLRRYGCAPFPS